MKNHRFLLLLSIFFSMFSLHAQECQVLVVNLQGEYSGGCKNGLAHGKGIARGVDTYKGRFSKGYPHGRGTYTWADGSVYTGTWEMGMRSGEGTYRFRIYGKDTVLAGLWKDDRYLGPKTLPPKVIRKINITSLSFYRSGDGNQVTFLFRQNGMTNTSVEELMVMVNNGVEFRSGSQMGYQSVSFPFEAKVTYKTWNALRTVRYDCILEFTIYEPGRWEVRIEN